MHNLLSSYENINEKKKLTRRSPGLVAALPGQLAGHGLESVEEGPTDDDSVVEGHHGGHRNHAISQTCKTEMS